MRTYVCKYGAYLENVTSASWLTIFHMPVLSIIIKRFPGFSILLVNNQVTIATVCFAFI